MFDLNELPEGDGSYPPPTAKAECETPVADAVETAFFNGNSTKKIICRLLRDEEAEVKDAAAAVAAASDGRKRDSAGVAYPDEDWEAEELAMYDAANRAASTLIAPQTSEAQRAVESTTSSERNETLLESSAGFGISPLPEKLGQRNTASGTPSNLTTDFLNRPSLKLDAVSLEQKPGDKIEDGGNLDSRPSARKGKRAREDSHGGQAISDQSALIKRQARFQNTSTTTITTSVDANRGTGPSLSISVDRDASKLVTPSTSSHEDIAIEDAATSLSLGEASVAAGIKADVDELLSSVKHVLGLSFVSKSEQTTTNNEGEKAVKSVTTDVSVVNIVVAETGAAKSGLTESERSASGKAVTIKEVTDEPPFWFGQLYGESFGTTDVAAYSNEQIQSTSQLRSLPQVMIVDKMIKLGELLDAMRKVPIDDPIIQLRHSPGSAHRRGESFRPMLESLKRSKQGTTKASDSQVELQLGLRNGSSDGQSGPLALTGDDDLIVVVKFKEAKSPAGRSTSKKLFLMRDSVAEAVCDADVQFRRKFEHDIIAYGDFEGNILYGILCQSDESDRSADDATTLPVASATRSLLSTQVVLPETTMSKAEVLSDYRSSRIPEKLDVEPLERDSLGSVARTELLESTSKDIAIILKAKSEKETTTDGTYEARRLEKSKARKEDGSKDRQRDRDRDGRGKERERDGRSANKDVHRHTHRSSERNKESDPIKRDRSKDKDSERFKERDRHRDSHRELIERPKNLRDRAKEQEREKQDKQREKDRQRDREKDRERERLIRKRDRFAEVEKSKQDEKKLLPEVEIPAPGFPPPPGLLREANFGRLAPLSGKDISRRGKIVDEDVAFDEKYGLEVKGVQHERDFSASRKGVHTSKIELVSDVATHGKRMEDAADKLEVLAADVEMMNVKAANEAVGNSAASRDVDMSGEGIVMKRKLELDWILKGHAVDSSILQISDASRVHQANSDVKMGTLRNREGLSHSLALSGAATTNGKEIEDLMDHDHDTEEIGNTQRREKPDSRDIAALTAMGSKFEVQTDFNAGTSKGLHSSLASAVESGRKEDKVSMEMTKTVTRIRPDSLPPKPKFSLSVRVQNIFDPAQGQKYDDIGSGQELEASPSPIDKTAHLRSEDLHTSQLSGQYSPSAVDNGSVTQIGGPGEKDVSCDIVLQACDKDTRVWLASKPSATYLAEEFGVRIVKMEEIPSAKFDLRPKNQQGPVNVKVCLAAEKSTDISEAKWFINQAADILRAVASRGVFAKCLWYQGVVQRFGDQAPSIQTVVKGIKGDDGKNLERIQEVTGVMIGIVLDPSSKKGIVNSSRVIGLKLKCVRKRGFLEATKQVEELLAQVAEQFSKDTGGGSRGSQNAVTRKSGPLKVDCTNSASPASGILTPMQKDVFAAYSPVSPVTATTPLASSFKPKLDEPSMEVKPFSASAIAAASTSLPEFVSPLKLNPPPTFGEHTMQSQQTISEDDEPERRLRSDSKTRRSRSLFVSNLPPFASAPMLKELFEGVSKDKFGLSPSYDGLSEVVLDIKIVPEKLCAYVELASDELVMSMLKVYTENRKVFCGLKLDLRLPTTSTLKSEWHFLAGKSETMGKALELGGGPDEPGPAGFTRVRREMKVHRNEEHVGRFAGVRSSSESEDEVFTHERRYGSRDAPVRFPRLVDKPKPLFLTELMRNASPGFIQELFEDIIKKYINPSLGTFKGRQTVLDVRYIPSRGCAFVDLATSELVDFMLDLHSRRPEVFFNMKMEIGRPVPLGQGEEEPLVKRLNPVSRYPLLGEETHGYGSGKKVRRQFPSISPPRRDVTALDNDYIDDYDEDEEDERQANGLRKRRSDPERTVYADRLPENASEGMIRRIFERVLREHITQEQREVMGEHLITEVRYVPTKFCAFVVFGGEELTRLVLQLYNQDEDIFENMRLKPHFHSKMEDLYREDLHERDDVGIHRVLLRDTPMDRRNRRGIDDFHHNADVGDLGPPRGRVSTAHRAVAATAFKEVDRRRSVYVDRIPERLPEPAMRDMFERALRQNRHGFNSHSVSQVTFFRDKFDPDKLCAFVELETEELVQELLDTYMEDEEAFSGMRVRPAVKYGH